VDVVLHWHPGDSNAVSNGGELAMVSAKFTFHGVAAHAAMAPARGRSALDAVMLMGNGVEFMREHVPSHTRVHYIISRGGMAPNVVPDLAQLDLVARSPFNTTLKDVWEWIQNIAQGATLMTSTTVDVSGIGSYATIVPNDPLAAVAQKNLQEVGGYKMNADEQKFALELQKTFKMDNVPSLDTTNEIEPLRKFDPNEPAASTDVGDVSWNVPTIGFSTATFVPGSSAHTWQATAAAGMSIGQRGMVVAAKAIALTALDLLTDASLVQAAKDDFRKQTAGRHRTVIVRAVSQSTNFLANQFLIISVYTASCGVCVRTGRRQSIPSSNIESCAGVNETVPLVACGQMNLPRSNLFANRHKPSPSHHSILIRCPRRPRNTNT
jgi:aminobenzoyl-glutamate utilization protein B